MGKLTLASCARKNHAPFPGFCIRYNLSRADVKNARLRWKCKIKINSSVWDAGGSGLYVAVLSLYRAHTEVEGSASQVFLFKSLL